ncbi:signal recognition particle-docking protein FtsY [Catenovulum agarivorans DS-2]|uniref:Signal recognition particle receptor FtsY n=1 Tax=Catenovulum agarivorans DS-2 TaxID=1328313 RepID=W7QRI9_9ALTE|nr:signal recognition particle-docking protein FtsY [Catenovulum agarivorans]EWH11582.1 signal recognition particle-docking protein FtsY [Catenovulum agarivorans DS-2]
MSQKKGLFGWFGRKSESKTTEQAQKTNESKADITQTQSEDNAVASEVVEKTASTTQVQTEQNNESAPQTEQAIEQVVEVEPAAKVVSEPEPEPQVLAQPEPQQKPKKGLFARLKASLTRTKASIGSGLFSLFKGKKIDDELYEDLETQLLMADVGIETTMKIIDQVTESAEKKQLKEAESLYTVVKDQMQYILQEVEQPLAFDKAKGPFVMLMVGVNGVGKTTTIGKLAKQYQQQGKSVMLAAGDTFRAAAVEQLQVWGQRNDIAVVAQHTGADSASVIFDAYESAKSKNVDILIADTAGRLQNKSHLMEELKKIVRVMKKIDPEAPHEIMLVVDATTGQNAISQAKLFGEAVGLTGISLTKLDGTAKGGVIFAIADKFKVPIRYIGVGEGIDDLRPFAANDFIDALFAQEESEQAE